MTAAEQQFFTRCHRKFAGLSAQAELIATGKARQPAQAKRAFYATLTDLAVDLNLAEQPENSASPSVPSVTSCSNSDQPREYPESDRPDPNTITHHGRG